MSSHEEKPLYIVPGIPTAESLQFNVGNELIEIDNEHSDLVWAVLKHADGLNTRSEITGKLVGEGIESEYTEAVLDDLAALGIIVDSIDAFRRSHDLTKNPSPYQPHLTADDILEITERPYEPSKQGSQIALPHNLGLVGSLSERRESCREFETAPLTMEELGEIFANAYSLEQAPVPSAGGLYPLRIYAVIKPGHDIPTGNYQYDPNTESLILYSEDYDEQRLEYVLNQEDALHDAPVVIILAADLSRHKEKYGNRGYRYSLLEAGHVGQNIHLTASELSLASLEYGGFSDNDLSDYLDLPEPEEALVVIGVGKEKQGNKKIPTYQTLLDLERAYVGIEKPIDTISVHALVGQDASLNLYSASAHYRRPNEAYSHHNDERYASGVATSMHLAQVKAIAEAYERYASGRVRTDFHGAATEIKGSWIHPGDVRPLSPDQLKDNPHIAEFDASQSIEWVEGLDAKGTKFLIPAELVYYPLNSHIMGRSLYSEADSSGVAAFTDRTTATRKALLELIERHQMMKNWFSRDSLERIDHSLAPVSFQRQASFWAERGYDTHIVDMSEDTPVVQVIIVNREKKYPYFVNGASAADCYEEAITKALEEAELGLTHALATGTHALPEIDSIVSPADHGIFYLHPENAEHISWLWTGSIKTV